MLGTPELESLIIKVSTPFYLVLIGLELLLTNWQHRPVYTLKDTVNNTVLMLLNGSLDLVFRVVYLAVLMFCYQYSFSNPIDNPYLYWFSLFILEDFVFYVLHVVDHRCRLFWAVHVTHHSSEHFNLSTGFRSSVFQPLYRFIYFIPLTLAGFHPMDIILMYSITQTYGIIVHTKTVGKLGWLEYVLVTPSHHRVHHASNVQYLDKNMGMCLIVWDRLFGTYQDELPDVQVKFGLTSPLEDHGVAHTVFHEWKLLSVQLRKAKSGKEMLKYLFYPPGWTPDGTGKTTKELRRELTAQD